MLKTSHFPVRPSHRTHTPWWVAAPLAALLAAIVFSILPHEASAPAKTTDQNAATVQPDTDSPRSGIDWLSTAEPLPNVQD